MMRDTLKTCEIYQQAVASGEEPSDVVGYLAEWYNVQRPAIWRRLRAGGVLPGYRSKNVQRFQRPRRKHSDIRDEKMAAPRVDRDACPRCGVRADIGCKHSRAPVGMMFQ